MSEKPYEKLGNKGIEKIADETRRSIQPIIKEMTKKLSGLGFNKKEFAPAIKKGLDDAKGDV